MSPLPGQYFCKRCMRPIPTIRNEQGLCDNCLSKELTVRKAGNVCDFCHTPGTKALLYVNKKTKNLYCAGCRSVFRTNLVAKGFETEEATKIMIQDFVLVNDPTRNRKKYK